MILECPELLLAVKTMVLCLSLSVMVIPVGITGHRGHTWRCCVEGDNVVSRIEVEASYMLSIYSTFWVLFLAYRVPV